MRKKEINKNDIKRFLMAYCEMEDVCQNLASSNMPDHLWEQASKLKLELEKIVNTYVSDAVKVMLER